MFDPYKPERKIERKKLLLETGRLIKNIKKCIICKRKDRHWKMIESGEF